MALFIIFGMFGVTNGNILFGVETFRLMYKDRRFFTFNFANNKEFVLFNYIYNIIYFIPITIFGIFYFEATSYGSDPINNSI
jgi:Na+/H+-dicarboxylate symporter